MCRSIFFFVFCHSSKYESKIIGNLRFVHFFLSIKSLISNFVHLNTVMCSDRGFIKFTNYYLIYLSDCNAIRTLNR